MGNTREALRLADMRSPALLDPGMALASFQGQIGAGELEAARGMEPLARAEGPREASPEMQLQIRSAMERLRESRHDEGGEPIQYGKSYAPDRMSKQLRKRLDSMMARGRKGSDQPDYVLEAQARQESYLAGNTAGGRVETYADGSKEYVPNLPDGTPQATIGEVFYDPNDPAKGGEAVRRMARGGYTRGKYPEGGLVSLTGSGDPKDEEDMDQPLVSARHLAYKKGGLAMAVGGVPEDDDESEDLSPGTELIDQAKDTSYGARSRKLSEMTRDKALARLGQARTKLEGQKRDQSMKWLAFAQGMLSPTRTGSFGESLGTTAGLVGKERQKQQEFEEDKAERLLEIQESMGRAEEKHAERDIDITLEEEKAKAVKIRAGLNKFNTYVEDPDDPTGPPILAAAIVDPREPGGMRILEFADGRMARVPDNYDPILREKLARAMALGKLGPAAMQEEVDKARVAKNRLASSYFGLDLLKKLKPFGGTGGIQTYIQEIREVFGDDAKDVADRGQLMAIMGDQLFAALEHFGTQINVKELQIAKSELAAGATRSTAVNERILELLVQELEGQLVEASTLINLPGGGADARQRATISMPLVDYGLTDNKLARGKSLGFKFRKHIPFASDDETPAPMQGRSGGQGKRHEPATGAEFNAMMRDRDKYDIVEGDLIKLPGKDGAWHRVSAQPLAAESQ